MYKLFPVLERLRASKGTYLSGGEQKMLAIGRALMKNPELILLDEPIEGLAPLVVRNLVEVIREIQKSEVTILLADQNHEILPQGGGAGVHHRERPHPVPGGDGRASGRMRRW